PTGCPGGEGALSPASGCLQDPKVCGVCVGAATNVLRQGPAVRTCKEGEKIMSTAAKLDAGVLTVEGDDVVGSIGQRMREILSRDLSRRGFVVAISGGIDSAVCAALAVSAVGAKRVYGLLLPEKDSSGF